MWRPLGLSRNGSWGGGGRAAAAPLTRPSSSTMTSAPGRSAGFPWRPTSPGGTGWSHLPMTTPTCRRTDRRPTNACKNLSAGSAPPGASGRRRCGTSTPPRACMGEKRGAVVTTAERVLTMTARWRTAVFTTTWCSTARGREIGRRSAACGRAADMCGLSRWMCTTIRSWPNT